jgi:hypothetical protein
MSKTLKEDCQTISMYDLKKWNCLKGYYSGTITWTSGWAENKSSVSYIVDLASFGNEKYFDLEYTVTDKDTEEKHKIKHKYPILTTPCNYGGARYWFECSVYHQGVYCGRKVAKLYIGNGSHYFACRHCYNLAYQSQMYGDRYKGFVSIPDIERAEKEVKRWHYRGKPTKKYSRVIKLSEKFERGFLMSSLWLLKKYK